MIDELTELDILLWAQAQEILLLRPTSDGGWSLTFRAPYDQVFAHKTVDANTPTECFMKAIRLQRGIVKV